MSFSFSDCDEFSEILRHEDAEVIQTRSGKFSNSMLLAPLENTLFRYSKRTTPWVAHATGYADHISLLLDLHNPQPVVNNGQLKDSSRSLALYGRNAEHHSVVVDPGDFTYIPFPAALLNAAAQAAQMSSLPVKDGACAILTPGTMHFSHLCQTVEAIRRLAEESPEVFLQHETRSGMERTLISALVLALSSCERHRPPIHAAEQARILRRAQDYLHDRAYQPVYMLELCEAAGAPERTLRDVFLKHLGMPPMRYLKLRRLRESRAILKRSDPATSSVKAAALDTGFWDLGRFAVDYKSLFGESPSATLMMR